jgi:stage III sporulation protein AG
MERLKNMFTRSGEGGAGFNSRLLVLLVVGIALITFNSMFSGVRKTAAPVDDAALNQAEEIIGEGQVRELAALLNQIRGVSNVSVFLTLEDTGKKELVYDEEQSMRQTVEQDSGGGTREITEDTSRRTHVILRDAQGREIPLVVRENQPRYRGVLVVADGVGDPSVRALVVEALRAILGLPHHRITVLPRGK